MGAGRLLDDKFVPGRPGRYRPRVRTTDGTQMGDEPLARETISS